jgi:multiple sugar transport system substrate-binding protein
MREVDLAVFDHGDVAIEKLQVLLKQFEIEKQVHVNLETVPWRGGWSRIISIVLYGDGIDMTEVGSTWVGDFYRMDALRSFTTQEIYRLGGKDKFLPACWGSGVKRETSSSPEEVLSIPWSADTRVIFYRKDLLREAGVIEEHAFDTIDAFENTLAQLKAYGIEVPLVLPTVRSRLTIHNLASWIWGAGGDFVNPSFNQVAFTDPEALQSIIRYFQLGQYLPKNRSVIEENDVNDIFAAGEAAVTIGGHWLMWDQRFSPAMWANIGLALVPGQSFVGGEHLVIWKHSRRQDAAVQLIQKLVNSEAALDLYPLIGLPATLAGLERPPFSTDPHYRIIAESLRKGRSLPTGSLWGMVETRLTEAFPLIWKAVLAEENPDIEAIVRSYLESVAKRLNITLQS